jgi:hypothetical protein
VTDAKAPQQDSLFLDTRGRRQQHRWIAAQQRRDDAKARFAALPDEERQAIWQRVDRLLFREAIWIRAKSPEYADNPHAYARRRDFKQDDDFRWLITMIREGGIGTRERFPDRPGGRWYDVLNYRGAKFWPMGWPLNYTNGTWCTVILNKKPVWPTDR